MKPSEKIAEFKLLTEEEELLWVGKPINQGFSFISILQGSFILILGALFTILPIVVLLAFFLPKLLILGLLVGGGIAVSKRNSVKKGTQFGYSTENLFIMREGKETRIPFSKIGKVTLRKYSESPNKIVVYAKNKKSVIGLLEEVEKTKTVIKGLNHSIQEYQKRLS